MHFQKLPSWQEALGQGDGLAFVVGERHASRACLIPGICLF